jgi:hypothetical protein
MVHPHPHNNHTKFHPRNNNTMDHPPGVLQVGNEGVIRTMVHPHNNNNTIVHPRNNNTIVHPPGVLQLGNEGAIRTAVSTLQESGRPVNTTLAYSPKELEYFAYCDHRYRGLPDVVTVTPGKLYEFLFYQAMRQRRKRGRRKRSLVSDDFVTKFSGAEFDCLMLRCHARRPGKF